MTPQWQQLLLFTIIPFLTMSVGGIIAFIKQPGPRFTSAVQHFAAGVVFAAVALELLPKVVNQSNTLMALGFALGLGLMLFIEWFSNSLSKKSTRTNKLPLGMILGVGIDVFIDGILIGVSFLASQRSGIFIALALALEVLFLGLSASSSMAKNRVANQRGILIIVSLALLIPIGAFLGYEVVSHLSKAAHLMILSFGVAALLYLVTEELLTEAHEVVETPIATSAFFVGFLVIMWFS